MSTVKELKATSTLPKEFLDLLPTECEDCGYDYTISPSLSSVSCENPFCYGKTAMRMRAICTALNIKGLGETGLLDLCTSQEIENPLQLFNVKKGEQIRGLTPKLSQTLIPQILANNTFRLWEYVSIANLPGIQTVSKTLIEGYSDLEDFYHDLEETGVFFIQDKLGLGGSGYEDTVSLRATQIYESLVVFKHQLFEGLQWVNIYEEDGDLVEYNIVASDTVGGGFKRKKDFFTFIQSRYQGKCLFNITNSVTKKTDVLIWAGYGEEGHGETSKVKKFNSYVEKGLDAKGFDAKQFIEYFDKVYGVN